MREFVFRLDKNSKKSLQAQIREVMVAGILAGHLKPGSRLPSTRRMSEMLGVSRNTAVLSYQGLIDDGYLRTSERSGYFVAETMFEPGLNADALSSVDRIPAADAELLESSVDWSKLVLKSPAKQRNIVKPKNWQSFPYPFIYGQSDPSLFPIADWRDCVYKVVGKKWLDAWSADTLDNDDDMLIEQIRDRILPRRGILVDSDQIIVTLGAQLGLYMIASLLIEAKTRIAMENPGYRDARNIFELRSNNVIPIPVDGKGMQVDDRLKGADLVYVTPSHQLPTTVTMPPERRKDLLQSAHDNDFLIIEDDYELETNYIGTPLPALKANDVDGRVIYVSSFSKTLFPGLRLGFMVAPATFIEEVRALRRLMVRHPPNNNQRTTAFFLSLGYYDVYVRRMHRAYSERWKEMGEALQTFLPNSATAPSFGGSSFWVKGPEGLDADVLATDARERGIIIEPGTVSFDPNAYEQGIPRNYFRLGFSSIGKEKIRPGIEELAQLIGKDQRSSAN